MCIHVCTCGRVQAWGCPQSLEEDVATPGARITGSCEQPEAGAGNWTWAFWKSGWMYLNHQAISPGLDHTIFCDVCHHLFCTLDLQTILSSVCYLKSSLDVIFLDLASIITLGNLLLHLTGMRSTKTEHGKTNKSQEYLKAELCFSKWNQKA